MNKAYLRIGVVLACAITVITYQGCGSGFEALNLQERGEVDLGSGSGPGSPNSPIPPPTCTSQAPIEKTLPQRLTKIEYNNVVRDLFGINGDFSSSFGADSAGDSGYVTDARAQNLSPEIVGNYWSASKEVVDAVFDRQPNPFLTCNSGAACAATLVTNLTTRAFRRPPSAEEVNELMALFNQSSYSDFAGKMKTVVRAVLMSPQFLFRTFNVPAVNTTEPIPLTDYELASRLSFFIWGSIPDQALLNDAAAGRLTNKTVLQQHALRLLADDRASYLARSFAPQWLELDRLERQELDPERFPNWSEDLKISMMKETMAFMNHIITNDRNIKEVVGANYTIVDDKMAEHYSLNKTSDQPSALVALDAKRKGILTHASVLTMTSASDHTTPVIRGQWVLGQMLCSSPPAPPADVPPLEGEEGGEALLKESAIRERLAGHQQQGSTCIACHATMDPIGLSFEQFDSAGLFRTQYVDGKPVDSSGKLPTGEVLNGAADLATVLESDQRFPSCLAANLSTFALGRNMTTSAYNCMSQKMAAQAASRGLNFSDLIVSIVTSDQFLKRKADLK